MAEIQADMNEGGAGARVMREIIRTPAFLEIIKTNMASLDPETARAAVHTLMWEEPSLSLSIAAMVPEMVNYMVEAVLELGRTLDNFPPQLLDAFVDQLSGGVDQQALARLPEVYRPVLEKVEFQRRARRAAGQAVNAMARMINRSAAGNPYFIRDSLSEVDGREVFRAGMAIGRSLAIWAGSGIKKYVTSLMGYARRGDLS